MKKRQKRLAAFALGTGAGAFVTGLIAVRFSPRVWRLVDRTADDLVEKGRGLRRQAEGYIGHSREVIHGAISAGKAAYHESMARSKWPHAARQARPVRKTGT